MKLIKDEFLVKLFDIYKNILSETQRAVMTDFIDNDLTISEIAENSKISRQAVFDAIKKSVAKMQETEKVLQVYAKISSLEAEIEKLKKGRV